MARQNRFIGVVVNLGQEVMFEAKTSAVEEETRFVKDNLKVDFLKSQVFNLPRRWPMFQR